MYRREAARENEHDADYEVPTRVVRVLGVNEATLNPLLFNVFSQLLHEQIFDL